MAFLARHLGNRSKHVAIMLNKVNPHFKTLDDLTSQIVPKNIQSELDNIKNKPISEEKSLSLLLSNFNSRKHWTEGDVQTQYMLGQDFNETILPNVIKRNLLENPKWYTSYTPYQAEISQGRLESLFNFQTMISDLTDLEVANCSLLDTASAACEAFNMSINYHKSKRSAFFCDLNVHSSIKSALLARAKMLNCEVVFDDFMYYDFKQNHIDWAGVLFAYPDINGDVHICEKQIQAAKDTKALIITHNDIMSLLLVKPPGSIGVDISFGTTQRFGLPLWNGGPHSAFFASKEPLVRLMPGRIVGETICRNNKKAFRLALQTREQHIKKDKASSNICTSQALLANTSVMWAIYHGKQALIEKAIDIYVKRHVLNYLLSKLNKGDIECELSDHFNFDQITIRLNGALRLSLNSSTLADALLKKGFIVKNDTQDNSITLSISEKTTVSDIYEINKIISIATNKPLSLILKKEYLSGLIDDIRHYTLSIINSEECKINDNTNHLPIIENLEIYKNELMYTINSHADFFRKSNEELTISKRPFLSSLIFNDAKSETWMLRYMNRLVDKDYSLVTGMIPLGSCTMKLNSTTQMTPLSWPEIGQLHPFSLNNDDFIGYDKMLNELSLRLLDITGFDHINYQSNSGAMGELSGLAVISKYHEEHSNGNRNTILIPESAHGTNFSSAKLSGLTIKKFKDNITLDEFKELCNNLNTDLAGMMITYPTTYGLFNADIKHMCEIVHNDGGLVYMDGANMNAQCGLTSPRACGADVCHLNLHKTFCIPHGGGGPGMGPILVVDKLKDYFPRNPIKPSIYCGSESKSYGTLSMSANSSASILSIPLLYLQNIGNSGLKQSSQHAILNATYLKKSLEPYYEMFSLNSDNNSDLVGHEFIIKLDEFSRYGITEKDISKRLIDYSFHPPTMSWPLNKSLMIEPTESEDKEELDRFIKAMISIRKEIDEVINKEYESNNNVLVNAPHSLDDISEWTFPYSIEKGLYPVEELKENKHYPCRSRINDIWGDRNLVLREK